MRACGANVREKVNEKGDDLQARREEIERAVTSGMGWEPRRAVFKWKGVAKGRSEAR